jgi:hypothetical protein
MDRGREEAERDRLAGNCVAKVGLKCFDRNCIMSLKYHNM